MVDIICVRRLASGALTVCRPVSYKLESKLGSRVELAAAVKACKAAGVGVIADVLFNRPALPQADYADGADMANTHLSGPRGINGSAVGDYSFAAVRQPSRGALADALRRSPTAGVTFTSIVAAATIRSEIGTSAPIR